MQAMLSKTSGQLVDMENAGAVMSEGTGAEQIEIHYLYRFADRTFCLIGSPGDRSFQ